MCIRDRHLATQFCRDFLNAGPDFATSYRSIWKYDLPKGFAAAGSRLPCPTLILGGGADRIAYMHQRVRALFPGADEVFMPEATDFVAEQNPELFARIVGDFLAS